MKEKITLLIDGDVIAYRASLAVEQVVDWSDDCSTLHSNPEEAFGIARSRIAGLVELLQADKVIVAFTGSENFRKKIYPDYKNNRKGLRKPVCYSSLLKMMKEEYKTYSYDRLEADDVLAIMATSPKIKGKKIIVSVDKDFNQVPGYFYNFDKDKKGKCRKTTEEQGLLFLYQQILIGDTVDGYKGCPGVGPVKAAKLLEDNCDWSVIVDAFEKAGLTEEDALTQARLAYLLRHGDYTKEGKIKLWKPQKSSRNSTTPNLNSPT